MNIISDMACLKEINHEKIQFMETNHDKHYIYWHSMKFDQTKHNADQFAYDLKISDKMIDVSDEQVLEHFRGISFKIIDGQFCEW